MSFIDHRPSSRLITSLRAVVLLGALGTAMPLLAQRTQVLIQGDHPFPESVTSSPDGALIAGSTAQNMVYRAAPGAATATPWIPSGTNGLQRVLGVLADGRSNTLWVCSVRPNNNGTPSALKSFDLKTGAPKASYDLPSADGVCNDVAIAADGTAYATDTKYGRILRLRPGSKTLETWAEDSRIVGADGIAFGDQSTLFVNTFTTNRLFRILIGKDGKPTVEELKTSAPLSHPDGIRPLTRDSFLMVEGAGRLDKVTVSGDNATINVLKDGFEDPTAVTRIGNTAWVLDAKLNHSKEGKSFNGTFPIIAVPLH